MKDVVRLVRTPCAKRPGQFHFVYVRMKDDEARRVADVQVLPIDFDQCHSPEELYSLTMECFLAMTRPILIAPVDGKNPDALFWEDTTMIVPCISIPLTRAQVESVKVDIGDFIPTGKSDRTDH